MRQKRNKKSRKALVIGIISITLIVSLGALGMATGWFQVAPSETAPVANVIDPEPQDDVGDTTNDNPGEGITGITDDSLSGPGDDWGSGISGISKSELVTAELALDDDVINSCDCVTPCDCDFDGDGDVDLSDFAKFSCAFGTSPGDPYYDEMYDLDGDGDIDMDDFKCFKANYGLTCDGLSGWKEKALLEAGIIESE